MLLALCSSVEGQQPKKFFRIGVLFIGGRNQPHLEAFKQGLRERGYTEGKNITFEYRYAEGKEDRLPGLAAELVHLKVDVIVVTSDVGAQAVQQATKTLPIVVTTGDPVASGLADSLAKPGGNVTGLSVLLADLSGKRVEILRETLPKLTRLATLWNPAERVAAPVFKETSSAAQALSLQLHSFEVQTPQDIEKAFVDIPKVRANALLVILSPLVTLHSKRIVEMALKQHLPGMYPTRQFAEEGGLMAYGPLIGDLYRRAADLRGQDSQRRKARRSARGAADEIRVHHQSESGEADRPDDSAERAGAGGQGDSMNVVSSQWSVVTARESSRSHFAPCSLRFAFLREAQQPTEKSSASVSWMQALLLVARVSWRRSGRRCASLDGSRERISPSSTGLQSKRMSACLSLQRTWFVSRLI